MTDLNDLNIVVNEIVTTATGTEKAGPGGGEATAEWDRVSSEPAVAEGDIGAGAFF